MNLLLHLHHASASPADRDQLVAQLQDQPWTLRSVAIDGPDVEDLLREAWKDTPRAVLLDGQLGEAPGAHALWADWLGLPVLWMPPARSAEGWRDDDWRHPDHFGRSAMATVLPSDRTAALATLPEALAALPAAQPFKAARDAQVFGRLLEVRRLIEALRCGRSREGVTRVRRLVPAKQATETNAEVRGDAASGRHDTADPRRPLRICAVSHDASRTGAPLALLKVLRCLEAMGGFELHVATIGEGDLLTDFRATFGDRCHVWHPATEGPHHRPLLEGLRAVAPDLVLLNASPNFALASLLAWQGTPYLWWWHEGMNVAARDGHWFSAPELEGMMRLCLELPARLLVPAHDTACELAKFAPVLAGRMTHLPYGFDIAEFDDELRTLRPGREALRAELGVGEDDLLYLCVGSLVRRKNQHRLAQAFCQHLDTLPEAEAHRRHLVFLGELDREPHDSEPDRVRAAVPERWHAQVQLLGPKPSAHPYMVAADAQVLVSTNECSPLVNIESLLLETPVISSAVHGIPEVIADGERGFLVDPQSVDSIAGGLARFEALHEHDAPALARIVAAGKAYATTEHDVRRIAATLAAELERFATLRTQIGAPAPLGAKHDAFLQRQLTLRWALTKGDHDGLRHFARLLAKPASEAQAATRPTRPSFLRRVLRKLRPSS